MTSDLSGRRVLITGAARGIGAATAQRLHARGARVVLAGIEPDELARTAARCGVAPAVVLRRARPGPGGGRGRGRRRAPARARRRGRQRRGRGAAPSDRRRPGGVRADDRRQPARGLLHAARSGPHIAHERGYALAIASLAAAVHPPLLGAYSASKAGVEALADSLRIELAPSGARVGVAYFAELDTDMVRQGFGTAAAKRMAEIRRPGARVAPLEVGIDAIERGIARRSRRVVAPRWVAAALPVRMLVQRAVELAWRSAIEDVFEIARAEGAPLTTSQPGARSRT